MDVLYLKKEVWYTEEFQEGLKRGVIDIRKIKDYVIRIGNRQLEKKFAEFLENHY